MGKHKIPRKSTSIDMTAMCDVAFLLLTFFMLAATAKPEEVVVVDTPTSISEKLVPDAHIAILSIDKEGKVFYDMKGKDDRAAVLQNIAGEYQISIDPMQEKIFTGLSEIGVPAEQLGQFLKFSPEERKKFKQPGIPIDTANNQLNKWISATLLVDQNMPWVIKADKSTEYPKIKKVIEILQDRAINKFSLVTGLEEKPAGFVADKPKEAVEGAH